MPRFREKVHVSTQTGEDGFFINLSKSKHARLYYSECYRDLVLSFNINKCKHFIITKKMWFVLRNHIFDIDRKFQELK